MSLHRCARALQWVWLCLPVFCLVGASQAHAGTIENGKLKVDGQWVFLKTGCPLANFAVENLNGTVDVLISKGYNNIKINLYWDHFDSDGDGQLDQSLDKVNALIDHIHANGIYCARSFETYNVGGGGVPVPFFDTHPDAQAVNSDGVPAIDGEYGTSKKVPSIFHPAYLQASRAFIQNVLAGVDTSKILYFETTVEPQYIGNQELDYSTAGSAAWETYCAQEGLDPCPWPPLSHPKWHEFRAQALAEWIMGDAAAIREVAGANALIAVDYLETGGAEMKNRNGDSILFLTHLQGVDILQCNWHWLPGSNSPFDLSYQRANNLKALKGWAVTEHMTINGADFVQANIAAVLQHTLDKGNTFGWEIVATRNNSNNPFCVYNDDWSPKQTVAELDDNHTYWVSKGYGGTGQGYDGVWVTQDYPPVMGSGQVADAHLVFKNIGGTFWDTTLTRIGTTEPQDMESPFYDPGTWLSPDRSTAVDAPTPPGADGQFSFTLRAPEVDEPTEFTQHWGLVQDGVAWFGPPQDAVWFQVLVTPDMPEPEPDVVTTLDVISEPEQEVITTPDMASYPEAKDELVSDLQGLEPGSEVILAPDRASGPDSVEEHMSDTPAGRSDGPPDGAPDPAETGGRGSSGGCQLAGMEGGGGGLALLGFVMLLFWISRRRPMGHRPIQQFTDRSRSAY